MTSTRQLWDISAPIDHSSPVYPGDTPYRQVWTASIGPQCPVNVSTIEMSPHIGTHADAPLHYDALGTAMGAVDLAAYIGPCRVIHAVACGPLIEWQHIAHAITPDLPARVLVRTYAQAPQHWDDQLTGFAPHTIERLADLGVQLIGIDTASIDPASSQTLDSHMLVRARNLRVLENLVLDAVPEGDYELIALPLKLMQADASPVRAVLRSL
ncbi:MAG: arylformamidase [Comamonas sp.]|nr:arylformamidase [Comamonas sp.]